MNKGTFNLLTFLFDLIASARGMNTLSLSSIRFKTPTSDNIIVDRYKSDQCIEFLQHIGVRHWTICDLRGEKVYLDCLLLMIIRRILRINCTGEYIRCFLWLSKAKKVFSYVDDSPSFYIVASKMKKVDFHVFQNGFRDQWELLSMRSFIRKNCVDTLNNVSYYSWGTRNIENFKSILDIRGINFSVYGSLSSRLIKKDDKPRNKQGILFISQYRKCGNSFSWENERISHSEFYHSENLVINKLSHFCCKNQIPLNVLASNSWQGDILEEEIEFYKKFGLREENFISCDNPYLLTDQFELVVSIDSSLGFEAASRGTKVLFTEVRFINKINLRRNRSLYPLREKIEKTSASRFVCFDLFQFEEKLNDILYLDANEYGYIWNSVFADSLISPHSLA